MATGARGHERAVTTPPGSNGEVKNEPGIVPGLDQDVGDGSVSTARAAVGQRFRVVFRGYDRDQVDQAVAALAERIAQLDGSVMPSFDALGQRVAEILRLAETEAEQLRAAAAVDAERQREDATRDAQELRRAAEAAVVEMRQRWADLLAQMSAARDELTTILDRNSTIDLTAEHRVPEPPPVRT